MVTLDCKIIEVSQGNWGNYGKFMLSRLSAEAYAYRSQLPGCEDLPVGMRFYADVPLLRRIGFPALALRIDDLQTCEGAFFVDGTSSPHRFVHQLQKHKIWVCPMFEPFVEWLGAQPLDDLSALPGFVALPDATFEFRGHRRQGSRVAGCLARGGTLARIGRLRRRRGATP